MMTSFGTLQAGRTRFGSLPPLAERLKHHASAVETQKEQSQKAAQKKFAEDLRQSFEAKKPKLSEELSKPAFRNSAGGNFSNRDVLEVVHNATRPGSKSLENQSSIDEFDIVRVFNLAFRPERKHLQQSLATLKQLGLITWPELNSSNKENMRVTPLGNLALEEIEVLP